jgi:peroxiredoxin
MDLSEELKKVRDYTRSQVFSADQIVQLDQDIENLAFSGISQNSLQVGDRVPDFSLNDSAGESVQLQVLLQSGAVVLSFFRGAWCPYCSLELQALEEILPTILDLQANLVSISPQTSRRSRLMVEDKKLTHPILIDTGNQVARKFGIVYPSGDSLRNIYAEFDISLPTINGDETYELPVPAIFIVDRSGIIAYRFVDPDYSKRVDPVEIITVLAKFRK